MESKRHTNNKPKSGKAPTRNVEYHEDAFEQDNLNVPEDKHRQLLTQIDKLVAAQNALDMDKARLEQQLKDSRSQVSRLTEENKRLANLLKQKDSLYEEMRQQLHEQLAVIENL